MPHDWSCPDARASLYRRVGPVAYSAAKRLHTQRLAAPSRSTVIPPLRRCLPLCRGRRG